MGERTAADEMEQGKGVPASPSGHSAKPEPICVVSAVPASVPNALVDGLGSIVSMLADARDTYPDDTTTLQAVTDYIHELYACTIDGVFGPITPAPQFASEISTLAGDNPQTPAPPPAMKYDLLAAARNVQLAWERATTGHMAGWEHLAMREAASAIEARSDATPKSGAAEGESAGPKDDAR